jgi:anti-anti-sigma factor
LGGDERRPIAATPAGELDALVVSWAYARSHRPRLGDEAAVSAHLLHADVESEAFGDAVVLVRARGVLDAFSAPALAAELDRAAGTDVRFLVLDLAEATLIDSSGLGAILAASMRLRGRGGSLALVAGTRDVMRGFELTGIDRVLKIFATGDEALAALLAGAASAAEAS